MKVLAIEMADEVLAARAAERGSVVDVDFEDPARLATFSVFEGCLEKVGAFPYALGRTRWPEVAVLFPRFQVFRSPESHFPFIGEDRRHDPACAGSCQKTLGSRKEFELRSTTGFPENLIQVRPRSTLEAMF